MKNDTHFLNIIRKLPMARLIGESTEELAHESIYYFFGLIFFLL